ncbi:hypothetical protein GCM10022209_44620 [Chitinophaga oryziterrae]
MLIFLLSCDQGLPRPDCKPQKRANPDVTYNIYIENSGSMAGYLGRASDFKNVLINFVSDVAAQLKKEPQLFLINGHACPFQPLGSTPLVKSIMGLNPAVLKNLCPPEGSSLLPQIIDSCTTRMEKKVSILVSDCIFSDKGGSPTLAEAELKVFMTKKLQTEGNISTIVIKYNSSFSGLYYTESTGGKPVRVNNINRPYYLLLFGKKENLATLLQRIDFKNYPGFEASYCLSANDSTDAAYAVMTYKNKKGSFEYAKPSCLMRISEAEEHKGVFQFSFDADLSRLGYLDDYLLNAQNYIVNDGFSVVDINKTTGEQPYSITLKTDHLLPPHSLRLLIKYDIPSWIDQTGNENDSNPVDSMQQYQTFGFKQLMRGFSQAYNASSSDHAFKLPINDIVINK